MLVFSSYLFSCFFSPITLFPFPWYHHHPHHPLFSSAKLFSCFLFSILSVTSFPAALFPVTFFKPQTNNITLSRYPSSCYMTFSNPKSTILPFPVTRLLVTCTFFPITIGNTTGDADWASPASSAMFKPHPECSLRSRRNRRDFTGDIFTCISMNEDVWISIKISRKFVHMCPINNIPALVRIMAWRLVGAKPLSEPMLTRFIDAYMRH